MSASAGERVEIRFPGHARYLPAIRALVHEMLVGEDGDPTDDETQKILLAIQEACVNAIRHGHHGDASKPVGLTVVNRPDRVELMVRDAGDGFRLPDEPPFAGDPTSESGRGLAIIQAVMDEVSVDSDEGATILSLIKRKRDG